MTPRNDAITAATAALWGGHRDIKNAEAEAKAIVKVLEALGVLAFKDPADVAETILSAMIIHATHDAPPDAGWMIGPYGAHQIVARLRGVGFEIVQTKAAPPVRPLFDPQADAGVSAVIEKTLYEKDWPDTAVAGFIIDDLRKAGFEIIRIFRNTP